MRMTVNAIWGNHRREAIALGAGGMYITAFAVLQQLANDPSLTRRLDNTRWTLDAFVGLLLTYLGWREAPAADRTARRWFLLGWLMYTVGQVLWDIQVAIGTVPFPGPSDPFYGSLPLFVSVGFLSVLLKGLTPRSEER